MAMTDEIQKYLKKQIEAVRSISSAIPALTNTGNIKLAIDLAQVRDRLLRDMKHLFTDMGKQRELKFEDEDRAAGGG